MHRPEDQTIAAGRDPAGSVVEASRASLEEAVAEVRDRVPELIETGARTLDQVAEHAPPAIEATIDLIDRSPTTTLAFAAGACAGLAVGLMMTRAPRPVALLVAGVALVLAGALIGRRRDILAGWE
jgi:ElaB/YqjD/DUF883 family membrane-anchored ribosome-binding protein